MNSAPKHRNRTADQILGDSLYYDSAGYLYRAVSWLDHFERAQRYTTLCYVCIEARLGIEYLLFEELVMSTGAELTRADYERCLRNRNSFLKVIKQLSPYHEKVQQFTHAVAEIQQITPAFTYWNPDDLMISWGKLSKYLHWSGSRLESTESSTWLQNAHEDVKSIIVPIWQKMCSGSSALLHPSRMSPHAAVIWADFRDGKIDIESVKRRLEIARP